MSEPSQKPIRSLILGGVIPVIAFTIVEEYFGILWGVVAGMVFAVGEILVEWRKQKRVSPITWGGGVLILLLGGVSLATQEGVWFKLQPALLEGVFGVVLAVSCLMNKPLLVVMAKEQGMFTRLPPALEPVFRQRFYGLTWRLSLFFFLHTALATYAALNWSTRDWALLKGVGFTASFVVYMIAEVWILRKRVSREIGQDRVFPQSG
ncbi:MAG: septation protein IspZ [Bdellovibrionaceae bacterium]|nr:septation protein IspZ [Bdellovibrionales bacterium]MCB9255440.1 septation protein IspZ [Pseudobdellovibrionaceae bacterium]